MPQYEFKCLKCDSVISFFGSYEASTRCECPQCGSPHECLERQLNRVSYAPIQNNGSSVRPRKSRATE